MNSTPPSADNPFAVLGLQPVYRLDNAEVERAYLTKLALAHPDRVGEAGSIDAAKLNEARKCLLDPEKRANALLSVLGGKSSSEDRTLPDGFLMEIMEQRQAIEEDLQSDEKHARARWQQWAGEERAKYSDETAALFDAYQLNAAHETLDTWRATLNAWRYIERLIEQLDDAYNPAQADFS